MDFPSANFRDALVNTRPLFHKVGGCKIEVAYLHTRDIGEHQTVYNIDGTGPQTFEVSSNSTATGVGFYETLLARGTRQVDGDPDPDLLGFCNIHASIATLVGEAIIIADAYSALASFSPYGNYTETEDRTVKSYDHDPGDPVYHATEVSVEGEVNHNEDAYFHDLTTGQIFIKRVPESETESTVEDGKGSRSARKWLLYFYDEEEEIDPDDGLDQPGYTKTKTIVIIDISTGASGVGSWHIEHEEISVTLTLTEV